MNVSRSIVLFVVLALAAPVRAEPAFDPMFAPALEKALAPMAPVKAELLKQTLRLSAAARGTGKAGTSGLKKKPRSATDFKPVLAGRPVLDAWMRESEQLSAEEKTAMRQGIESLLDMFAKEFRPNNLGSSVTIAIALCVMIVDDVDLTEKYQKDLDQTMSDVLANQAALLKLSAREKHAMSEELLTLSAIVLTFNSVGKESKNATTLRASVEMAKAMLTVLIGQPSSLPAK